MRWFTGWVLIGAAGCSGGEAESCDTFPVNVTVLNVEGQPQADAVVELNGVECANNGDGTYACQATYEPGMEEDLRAYQVTAIHGAFNPVSAFLQLEEGFCEGVPVTLQLGVMMGA